MTLEKLIEIVIEAVEKVIAIQKLKVSAMVFDSGNLKETEATALSINGKVDIKVFSETVDLSSYDILFLDYIPAEYLPELALGMNTSFFAKQVNALVISGKKVVVLKDTPLPDTMPEGCRTLLESYKKMLCTYGYKFISESADQCEYKAYSPYESKVYTNNVLSRNDLITNAVDGQIKVCKSVVITDLALEAAKDLKIDIIKV